MTHTGELFPLAFTRITQPCSCLKKLKNNSKTTALTHVQNSRVNLNFAPVYANTWSARVLVHDE